MNRIQAENLAGVLYPARHGLEDGRFLPIRARCGTIGCSAALYAEGYCTSNCDDLRRIALSLPEAYEQDHFGGPSFRVATKIFASCSPEKNRATLKLDCGHQTMLFEVRPEAFTPAVWGKLVWTYVALGEVEVADLERLVIRAWRLVAPKALVKSFDDKA